MADSFVTSSSESWLGRIGGAIKGVLVGMVLVLISVGLLFWGEGRAVKRAQALDEGSGKVVAVVADRVQPENEGALVHLTGEATTGETLADPLFGVSRAGVLRLARTVEMFQWVERESREEKKKLGGGTETVTTYTYETEWTASPVTSSSFAQPEGHENPPLPYSSDAWVASVVTLGAFILSPELSGQVSREESLGVTDEDLPRVPGQLGTQLAVTGSRFYAGADPATPVVGDLRVEFAVVEPALVSVVARQTGGTLASYLTDAGGTIALLSYGTKSPEEMFQAAQAANTSLAWVLRAVGFFLAFLGFGLIFKPLSVLADVVPFIGGLVGAGGLFVSFVLAMALSLGTIAVGWIFYRPALGVTLLVVVVGLVVWLVRRAKDRGPAAAPVPAASPVVPPPPPG